MNGIVSLKILSIIYFLFTMHFRNAMPSDLPTIVAIYNSTIPGRMVTADTEPVSVASREGWFYKHSLDKYPLLIAEDDDNNTIGWVSFGPFYGRPAYAATAEISIYLDAAQRGKGYGKGVLKHCLALAPALHIKTLLGFIFAHNITSLQLFAQLDFEEWGHLKNIATLDGVERSVKILGKRIG